MFQETIDAVTLEQAKAKVLADIDLMFLERIRQENGITRSSDVKPTDYSSGDVSNDVRSVTDSDSYSESGSD